MVSQKVMSVVFIVIIVLSVISISIAIGLNVDSLQGFFSPKQYVSGNAGKVGITINAPEGVANG